MFSLLLYCLLDILFFFFLCCLLGFFLFSTISIFLDNSVHLNSPNDRCQSLLYPLKLNSLKREIVPNLSQLAGSVQRRPNFFQFQRWDRIIPVTLSFLQFCLQFCFFDFAIEQSLLQLFVLSFELFVVVLQLPDYLVFITYFLNDLFTFTVQFLGQLFKGHLQKFILC